MKTIAVVDDIADNRESLVNGIEPFLKHRGWSCRPLHPLERVEDYLPLLADPEHGIAVLLLDERLNVGPSTKGKNVQYSGSTLAAFLRKRQPTFPIFMITSYTKDVETDKCQRLFEEILDRNVFRKHKGVHVERMVRAGQRFIEWYSKELNEFSRVARSIATGRATKKDLGKAKAYQTTLNLALQADEIGTRDAWLRAFEEKLNELKAIADDAQKLLKRPRKHA